MKTKFCSAAAGVLLLAAVSPACASSLISNGGFDDVLTSDAVFSGLSFPYKTLPNYVYPAGPGGPVTAGDWTYSGGAGLVYRPPSGSPFFDGADPLSGHQYGFLQNTGSFSQQFTSAVAGGASLNWADASRQNGGSYGVPAGDETYQVYLNGGLVGTYSTNVSSTGWTAESASVTLNAGTNTLLFLGIIQDTADNHQDQTAFIDNVSLEGPQGSIANTPLPAAWTMFVGGAAGLGFIARRRKRR